MDTQTVLVLLLFCFAFGNTVKQPFNCLQCETQTFCLVIVLFCYWKYGKATVQLSTIWHSICSGLVIVFFAIGNTVKQSFNCLQCDTQTVLVLLLFYFAIGNTVRHRSIVSNMTLKLSFLCYFLFCYWKYSKAPFNCLQYELKLSLCCYCFVLLLEIQ